MDLFALKGNIIYTPQRKELKVLPNAYAVCRNGLCEETYQTLPDEFKGNRRQMHLPLTHSALSMPPPDAAISVPCRS